MVEKIGNLVEDIRIEQLNLRATELKLLQAQINPHFLYNSLSLINWKAIMADQTEISEMAQLLSTFYRTTLNKGKSVTTVKGEWDNTCSYIRIQSIMHSGKFDVEQHVEASMMDCEMLNLILQPLVENAIGHGLDHKEGNGKKKLWVSGREAGDVLEFEVKDNGCGIPEEDIEAVGQAAGNAALEQARNEKKIGKSLEARVTLKTADPDRFLLPEMDEDSMADVFIVSQVSLEKGEGALTVEVAPAQGQKCERCWKVLPTVGSDRQAPHPLPPVRKGRARCRGGVSALEVQRTL